MSTSPSAGAGSSAGSHHLTQEEIIEKKSSLQALIATLQNPLLRKNAEQLIEQSIEILSGEESSPEALEAAKRILEITEPQQLLKVVQEERAKEQFALQNLSELLENPTIKLFQELSSHVFEAVGEPIFPNEEDDPGAEQSNAKAPRLGELYRKNTLLDEAELRLKNGYFNAQEAKNYASQIQELLEDTSSLLLSPLLALRAINFESIEERKIKKIAQEKIYAASNIPGKDITYFLETLSKELYDRALLPKQRNGLVRVKLTEEEKNISRLTIKLASTIQKDPKMREFYWDQKNYRPLLFAETLGEMKTALLAITPTMNFQKEFSPKDVEDLINKLTNPITPILREIEETYGPESNLHKKAGAYSNEPELRVAKSMKEFIELMIEKHRETTLLPLCLEEMAQAQIKHLTKEFPKEPWALGVIQGFTSDDLNHLNWNDDRTRNIFFAKSPEEFINSTFSPVETVRHFFPIQEFGIPDLIIETIEKNPDAMLPFFQAQSEEELMTQLNIYLSSEDKESLLEQTQRQEFIRFSWSQTASRLDQLFIEFMKDPQLNQDVFLILAPDTETFVKRAFMRISEEKIDALLEECKEKLNNPSLSPAMKQQGSQIIDDLKNQLFTADEIIHQPALTLMFDLLTKDFPTTLKAEILDHHPNSQTSIEIRALDLLNSIQPSTHPNIYLKINEVPESLAHQEDLETVKAVTDSLPAGKFKESLMSLEYKNLHAIFVTIKKNPSFPSLLEEAQQRSAEQERKENVQLVLSSLESHIRKLDHKAKSNPLHQNAIQPKIDFLQDIKLRISDYIQTGAPQRFPQPPKNVTDHISVHWYSKVITAISNALPKIFKSNTAKFIANFKPQTAFVFNNNAQQIQTGPSGPKPPSGPA
jgi:hypothetical protein